MSRGDPRNHRILRLAAHMSLAQHHVYLDVHHLANYSTGRDPFQNFTDFREPFPTLQNSLACVDIPFDLRDDLVAVPFCILKESWHALNMRHQAGRLAPNEDEETPRCPDHLLNASACHPARRGRTVFPTLFIRHVAFFECHVTNTGMGLRKCVGYRILPNA
jgi:hypothetical protein